MNIRSFDWRDLPALYRFRDQTVYLHTSLVQTWGPMTFSGALLSSFAPAMGISTAVRLPDGNSENILIGQTIQSPGAQNAQLTFLAPENALDMSVLSPLLEHLATQAVDRGAFRLLAESDEGSNAFEVLRVWGFAIYARQRSWRIQNLPASRPEHTAAGGSWRPAEERDLIPVRALYSNLIPALVQQVEPFPAERLHGYVYRQGEDLLAFVEFKYGHRGVWIQPFIHPDAEDVADRLAELLGSLPNRMARPIYLCVRSYQAWLERACEDLSAEPGPRQALMVKHLAVPQKAVRPLVLPAYEGGRPEISAPISQTITAHPIPGELVEAKLEN